MRVGEIKSIVKKVLGDNNAINIISDEAYGGQARLVKNYSYLIETLDILSNQKWNDSGYEQVALLKSNHPIQGKEMLLTSDEFTILNEYVNALNSKMPLFYSILESFADDQDEFVINIKLPEKIDSLAELSEISKKIEETLKLFNVSGEFKFIGFDIGTEWLVVLANGLFSYSAIISGLKIAQEYFKARENYFDSEKAKISYEISLGKKDSKESANDYEEYKKIWLEKFIEKEVEKAVQKIGLNGHTVQELNSKLVKATTKLIKELGTGVEFHLSLNPPSYVTEEDGELKIDYKKISASNEKKIDEVKTIDAPQVITDEK